MPSPLLLHGFTGSAGAWPPEVIEGLAARGHAPLALDLPGHGADAGTTDPARFTLEAVFRRILGAAGPGAGPREPRAAVTDDPDAAHATGSAARTPPAPPPFDLVGYSMGGRIALAFALAHPDRVRRLVLEGASPGLATEAERRARREVDEALARLLEEEGIEAFVEHWEALPLFATQRRLPPPVREAQRARRLANDPRSLAAALRGLGTGALPAFWDDLPRLETPVLLLVGEEDPKFVDVARRMAARLPRAVLRIVQGAGHNVHLERPEAWLQAVGAFLPTHPAAHFPPTA